MPTPSQEAMRLAETMEQLALQLRKVGRRVDATAVRSAKAKKAVSYARAMVLYGCDQALDLAEMLRKGTVRIVDLEGD